MAKSSLIADVAMERVDMLYYGPGKDYLFPGNKVRIKDGISTAHAGKIVTLVEREHWDTDSDSHEQAWKIMIDETGESTVLFSRCFEPIETEQHLCHCDNVSFNRYGCLCGGR